MSKTVFIPECMNPFEVIVNHNRYSYPGGTSQEVPDEVAEVIELHNKGHEERKPPEHSPEIVGGEEWFNDGNTHIWITLGEGRTSPMLGVGVKGTVTVDWGDGTEPDVLKSESLLMLRWTPRHEYAQPGDYIITLTTDGEMEFRGDSSFAYILRHDSGSDSINRPYLHSVKRVEVGSGVTEVSDRAFYQCYALTSVAIQDGVTSIGSYAFYQCYALTSVTIPDSVTSIGGSAFYQCYAFTSVAIPDSVTSIGEKAFQLCVGVRYYSFSNHTVVPKLSATSAFLGIQSDCEIRVPAALYDEWIAATNWTTYASQIVAV